ncbi:lysophospholipid acyltransferase family protein [Labrys sp. KB_33_2]|uniref:lysophospholipid acyltransferase family protein n=1 Tax=Labrys sp. KB_33_2 TaxID=3237479 RepID=UPI003F900527
MDLAGCWQKHMSDANAGIDRRATPSISHAQRPGTRFSYIAVTFGRASGFIAMMPNLLDISNVIPSETGRSWRNSKHAAEYLLLRGLVGLLHILPLDFGSWAMGSMWRLAAPRLRRHERALQHLAAAYPAKNATEIDALARTMWMHLGRTFAESLMVDRIVKAGRIEDASGPLIEAVKATGKGVVFVSLHTGNWELVVIPTVTSGIKVAGVYQRMKNPKVDDYVALVRRDRYPRGLFVKGANVGKKLLRIVRSGGAIALLADLRDRNGLSVPFFDRPAPSTTFPALLARGSDALLVAARVIRTRGVRFRIEAEILDVPHTDDRNADVDAATHQTHRLFEKWVREYPEQWMWAHRRWG